jgi:hypothetical protein
MSLDLYGREAVESFSRFRPIEVPDPGVFEGFARGVGMLAMREAARAGRTASLAVSAGVKRIEDLSNATGGEASANNTEISDNYFKFHDEFFQSAVDYWTPKPTEVGVAGQVVGQLLGTLPLVIASPAAAVGVAGLGAAEDLVRKGVSTEKAIAVGGVQAAGLGLGIWMPILGQNLWQRVVVGGAGFNLAQGAVTRGASGAILEGTPAADDFRAFDGEALTLDVLLGLAFGGITHLSPAQRAQGAKAWERIGAWAKNLEPSQVDALVVLRHGEHRNVDAAPGKLVAPEDVEKQAARFSQALRQTLADQPVEVSDLPAPRVEPDPARWTEADRRARWLQESAVKVGEFYDLVRAEPFAGKPTDQVQVTSQQIGDVLIQRGEAWRDGLEVRYGKYGLLKILFKHGEDSPKAPELQVTKEDVTRLPEILEEWTPIRNSTRADGKQIIEWQVPRADGRKVIYVLTNFLGKDQPDEAAKHLLTMFVNEEKTPKFQKKRVSTRREPDSPGGASKAASGDTGAESFSIVPPRGQGEVDSLRTEGPAGQLPGAKPPPPRGDQAGKPAGPEAVRRDPVSLEADRVVSEQPDMTLSLGDDAEGNATSVRASDYLAQKRADVEQARQDAGLFEAAARCLLGGN